MFDTNAPVQSRAYGGCLKRRERDRALAGVTFGAALVARLLRPPTAVASRGTRSCPRAASSVCALSTITAHASPYAARFVEAFLLVERALAERDDRGARRRDAFARARRPRRRARRPGTTRFTRPQSAAVARVDHVAGEQHLEHALAADRAADRHHRRGAEQPDVHSRRREPSVVGQRSRGRTRRRAGSRPRSRRRAPWRSPAAGSCAGASSARRTVPNSAS